MARNLRFIFAVGMGVAAMTVLNAHASTVPANTCQQADVNAVINGPTHFAVNGDTIQIPTGTCIWTSGIRIPAGIGITIVGTGSPNSTPGTTGAGTSSTIIVDAIPTNSNPQEVFVAAPAYGNATMRISMLEIEPQSGVNPVSPLAFWATCTSSGCPSIRVDNITFPSSWYGDPSLHDGAVLLTNNSWGVIDHNTITGVDGNGYLGFANFSNGNWLGVGQYGDNSWTQPDSLGTQQAIYLENNLFSTNVVPVDCDTSDVYGDVGGCRYVARFNADNDASGTGAFSNHGTESTGRPRGGRQAEVYNNTFICANKQQGCNSIAGFRSGVVYVFNNSVSVQSGSWLNDYLKLGTFRVFAGFYPWGYCVGQGPYDQNDGVTYYSGLITAVSTSGNVLTLTVAGTPWTASQWVNNGDPYSLVDTSITTVDGGGGAVGSPGYEITANTANTLSASGYSGDYWNPNKAGPPTFNVGDTIKILRGQYCIDQPSRSGGTLLSGTTPSPTGWVNEVLDPSYEWGDTSTSAPGHGPALSDSAKVIANRDFYSQVSTFTGAGGVGGGTLSARPSTCTTGVAYWDTSEGTWNQGQSGSGALDICTGTNTWTNAAYVPYAYPHPLISGSTSNGPGAPTAVTGTVKQSNLP